MVLDRASGAILKTSGQVDALQTAKARNASTAASFSNDAPAAEEGESQGIEEFAEMIWNFVNSSGQLVQDVDEEVREHDPCCDASPPSQPPFLIVYVGTMIGRLTWVVGRVEATPTANETTGDCHSARPKVPAHSYPRYSTGLKHLLLLSFDIGTAGYNRGYIMIYNTEAQTNDIEGNGRALAPKRAQGHSPYAELGITKETQRRPLNSALYTSKPRGGTGRFGIWSLILLF